MVTKLEAYQFTIFATMFIGYGCYAYNRKSVSFALPKLMEMGLEKSQAGLIISSQNMAYAISKFLGGILSDRMSSRVLFSVGLLFSGFATLAFSASHSVLTFTSLWFLNGFAQGCGWPACAKVLRKWFSPAQFGTWWSVMSASANISGGVSPFISAFLILNYGWRFSLVVAGIVSVILGVISMFCIVNSPTDIGLQSFVDDEKEKKNSGEISDDLYHKKNINSLIYPAYILIFNYSYIYFQATSGDKEAKVADVLRSPFLWLVSFCYMTVFCAKTSTVDWSQLYLMDDCGQTQFVGSSFVSSVETGGFFGGVLAGYLTDWVLKKELKKNHKAKGNPRMKVGIIFTAGALGCLHLLKYFVNENSSKLWITSIGMMLGACYYGPIAIYGVVATESAPSHLSGTAHAIVALAANIGAIVSGLPFSLVAKSYSWGAIFLILEVLTAITIFLMLVTRNMNSNIGKVKTR
ncbi:glucose-6-phosphate exchanger SLC37A4-like isoform X1 [Centruroides sculpturatus]|uniref:glucose-6-phosphate exchanger SLC37A4-like isoform X1 n=1 Tax=Centruroides sculpturatus TaxID=218467 RepID=UPI000C6EB568|nr:glucose-6-phosphate exchanger SLC37A4-like isoform X1 [Centruroides sculpturatus]